MLIMQALHQLDIVGRIESNQGGVAPGSCDFVKNIIGTDHSGNFETRFC